jgi:hypothetical protein
LRYRDISTRRPLLVAIALIGTGMSGCTDYGGYSHSPPDRLRDAGASHADTGSSAVDTGASPSADAGHEDAAPTHLVDSSIADSSTKDASSETPDADATPMSRFDAGEAGATADATVRIDAGPADASGPADTSDGRFTDLFDFSDASALSLFDYVTPPPYTEGPGEWGWFPNTGASNGGELVQLTNVAGTAPIPSGTFAVYRPRVIVDGVIEVTFHSADTGGTAGIVFGYADQWNLYRSTAGGAGGHLERIDSIQSAELFDYFYFCGGTSISYGCFDVSIPHRLRVEIRNHEMRGYVDGTLRVRGFDPSYTGGRVGLYTRAMTDAHFDDFSVSNIPPEMAPLADGGP